MRLFGKFFWGSLLLIVGVLWLLYALGVLDGWDILRTWWPMLIAVPCAVRMLFAPEKLLSLQGVAIGIILQLWMLGIIPDVWMVLKIAVPIAVICIALHLLIGRRPPMGGRPRR